MKRLFAGAFFFVIVLVFSILVNFPMEAYITHSMNKIANKTGIEFQYEKGKFSLLHSEISNLDIFRDGDMLMRFKEVGMNLSPGKASINTRKNGGSFNVNIEPSRTDLSCKNFEAISKGEKFFKKVILTGSMLYHNKKGTGTGKFKIILMEYLRSDFPVSDIKADTEVRISPEEITLNVVDLQGINLRGNGEINIEVNRKKFESSKLSGALKIRTSITPSAPPTSITIGLSGTLDNIQITPKMGNG
ncbi:MAG: hypothetical protein K8T10_18495 [Candidatus Eremiobacteraeota bacterium]|nr:hypothetical protein [Candidatus Eremiobacteraeota bacterium]